MAPLLTLFLVALLGLPLAQALDCHVCAYNGENCFNPMRCPSMVTYCMTTRTYYTPTRMKVSKSCVPSCFETVYDGYSKHASTTSCCQERERSPPRAVGDGPQYPTGLGAAVTPDLKGAGSPGRAWALGRGPWADVVGPPRRSGKMAPILGHKAGRSRTERSVRSGAQPPQDTWGSSPEDQCWVSSSLAEAGSKAEPGPEPPQIQERSASGE
uniref:Snake toxin/toxin-like domain-containing protein n=1 Tax=Suricata suricatta TaxID=37032 RepID=A0A673VQB3_SURSU